MSDKSAIIKEAQKYLARGQIDKAIAEWERLAKEYPDGNTFNVIGDLYLKKGGKTEAIKSYHEAADFFRREGFSLKALALYKKILNLNAADPAALISLGELNEAKGLVTDAIKCYLGAADSLSKEGNKEKVFEIYERILGLSPANLPLRSKVADIYIKEGLVPEAVRQYLLIARLWAEKGDTEKSMEFYRKVLDIQPLEREAILELNKLYENAGDLEQALEQAREACRLFPQDAEILLRCAELGVGARKFDEARDYLGKVIELEPANIKARRFLGDIYAGEGDREKAWVEYLPVLDEMLLEENYDDAISLLSSFKDIDPVETGKRLVSLYVQLGDSSKAVSELTSLGDVFIEKDRLKEALNCFKEAFKIAPDDEFIKNKVVELEKQVGIEHFSPEAEKTVEEAVIEADIYIRYGLHDKARDILEAFSLQQPENIDLRLRLKSLYAELGDKELAVSECLTLRDLYEKAGDSASSDRIIKEACEINPEDERLAAIKSALPEEEEAKTSGLSIEDYSEEIAEADFYSKQGLIDEAREILERLQNLFPENNEITHKLDSLGQITETREEVDLSGEMKEPAEEEILEVEEIAEPALSGDVMDILDEFKKGLEKELEEEDYETHYNLGIAYKEMGLIDDAIREFQASRKDPKRFVHSSNMLGVCYMEKGLYPLAVEVLKDAIEKMKDKDESYWAMKYDLSEAYEKNGNLKEALDLCTEVYGWNSKFRHISDKINRLRTGIVESTEQKKPKDRKDRVSYL
jgi:tetratricopeptide (TPR) repeat protein